MAAVVVISPTGRVPIMDEAFTANSPSIPFFAALRSISITSVSRMVELNFSPRSVVTLPHLSTETPWKT